jgi:hypothetical protein
MRARQEGRGTAGRAGLPLYSLLEDNKSTPSAGSSGISGEPFDFRRLALGTKGKLFYFRTMSTPLTATPKRAFIIPEDYPFRTMLEEQAKQIKHRNRRVVYEKLTIMDETPYLGTMFCKFFQNRDIFKPLSADACKIVVHIAIHLEEGMTRIELTPRLTGLSKYRFGNAILELVLYRIVSRQKRGWYWLNVALLVNGNPHLSTPNPDAHGNG